MRLWHYKLIPFLPDSQLLAQWRELNSIFKKQDKHILINYIYEYEKDDLFTYTLLILSEMRKRSFNIKSFENAESYFKAELNYDCLGLWRRIYNKSPFKNHHTDRYLMQCLYNLQEKYDRGQNDFAPDRYEAMQKLWL